MKINKFYKNTFQLKFLLILLFVGILNTYYSYSQDNLTFARATELMLEKNFNIRLVRKSIDIANNNVSSGNAGMLPTINASAGYNYQLTNSEVELFNGSNIIADNASNQFYNAGIELNWTLFDGFAMFKNFDKLSNLRDLSEIELQITIENNIRQLATNYYNAVKLQQNLNLLRKILEVSKERIEIIKTKVEFGTVNSIDLLSAEVDYNADSSNYLRVELELENIKRNIKLLIGDNQISSFNLDTNFEILFFENKENLKKIAFEKNSSIIKSIKQQEITQLDREIIATNYIPKLIFNSGYNYSQSRADQGFQLFSESNVLKAGLTAQVNLFDGFRTSIQSENAEINLQMQEITIDFIKSQIEISLDNFFNNYMKNQDLIILEEKGINLSNQNYQRTLELYQMGKISSLETRQALNNYLRAVQKNYESKCNLKLVEVELLLLSGQLIK